MALLFFDGFETASTNQTFLRSGWVPSSGSLQSNAGRNGGKSLGCTSTTHCQHGFAASATAIIGVAKLAASGQFGGAGTGATVIGVGGDAGFTSHMYVALSPTGQLLLRRGSLGSGTLVATSTLTVGVDQWFYIEMKTTIADAGGTCIVRVNGVEYLNFTGDTRNGGTSTNIDTVFLGTSNTGGSNTFLNDDVVIMDGAGGSFNDFIGDRTVRAIRPNGNGVTNQWVGSDGNTTDNYQLVDEDPFSSADYTGSATVGDRDIYAFSDLSITGTVNAVQVLSYAAKTDAGARTIKTLTRSTGGTVLASSAAALQTTYGVVDSPILLTDADGSPWTVATVNSAQYGVEVGA